MIKKWNQKNMKECDKRKSHISSKLHIINTYIYIYIYIYIYHMKFAAYMAFLFIIFLHILLVPFFF